MIKKDIDLENVEQQATASIEKLKVSAGTIRRIVALVVQGIISIAGVVWGQDILVNEGVISNVIGIASIVAMIVFVGIQAWAAWKNNSFTQAAKVADLDMKADKAGVTKLASEYVALSPEVQELPSDKEVK